MPAAATTARSAGASSTMATASAMKPTTSSSIPLPDSRLRRPPRRPRRAGGTRRPGSTRPTGTARWRVLLRRGRAAGQRRHDRGLRDRLGGPGGGEVGRDDREDHGDADDRPRQLERAHDVVRAVLRLLAGTASHARKPSTSPATAPTTPVAAPLARTTSLMLRSVAPWAASMPIARSLRCARTVKPPMPTSAISSMPRTAAAIEIVSGLISLVLATVWAVVTCRPVCVLDGARGLPGASNSTVTSLGAVTWPGITRANSSSRLCGFATMPVTFQVRPAMVQLLPTCRLEVGGDAAGDRDLVRGGRVLAADQAQQRPAERPVRVLRPQVEGVLRAGNGGGLVLDHVGLAVKALRSAVSRR